MNTCHFAAQGAPERKFKVKTTPIKQHERTVHKSNSEVVDTVKLCTLELFVLLGA